MNFVPKYILFEEKVRESFEAQKFMSYIGAKLIKVNPGYCEIHLPYKKVLTQQNGYFHAGIIGTIADNAGGYAAFSLMSKNSEILSVEYKINFVSPALGDSLIARGNVMKSGKNLTVCNVGVHSSTANNEKLCAVSQMTLICIDNPEILN